MTRLARSLPMEVERRLNGDPRILPRSRPERPLVYTQWNQRGVLFIALRRYNARGGRGCRDAAKLLNAYFRGVSQAQLRFIAGCDDDAGLIMALRTALATFKRWAWQHGYYGVDVVTSQAANHRAAAERWRLGLGARK